jgi:hypothetical protein
MKRVEATRKERPTAQNALLVIRRSLLVLVAAALVLVGAMTADHIDAMTTPPDYRSAVTIEMREGHDTMTGASMMPTSAVGIDKGMDTTKWSAGDLVLLTCSVVALLVLLAHFLRAGPAVVELRRREREFARPLPRARITWISEGPDRMKLCVIRT